MISSRRLEYRCKMIAAHLDQRPPWWRFFRMRAWKRRLADIRSYDVSSFAELIADVYSPDEVIKMAYLPRPTFGKIVKL